MNRSNSKVFKNSIFYSVSGLLQNCFSFFLLPLYTAYLSTNDYGVVSIAENFLSVMSYLCGFSMYTAVTRFYVEYKDDDEKLKRFYGTVTIFVFVFSVLYGLFFTICRKSVTKLIFSGTPFYPIVFVCLVEIVFHCQRMIYESILQGRQEAFKYSVISLALFVVKIVLTVFFVVVKKMGALGIISAAAIHVVLFFIVFIVDVIRHDSITFCIDKRLLKTALKYSVPIMPHNLSTHIANLVSKILIGTSVSLGAVGVFSIASKFGEVADVIQNYVNNAYGPWLYEKLHDGNGNGDDGDGNSNGDFKKSVRSTANILTAIIGFCCIGLALFSQEVIILLIDKSYSEAWHYIPLIVGIYTVKITYYFYVSVLFYFKQASRKLFIATLGGSLVNVICASIFIPKFGVYGSILADAVAMVVRILIVVYISGKCENIGLHFSDFVIQEVIILLFITVGMLYTIILQNGALSWTNVLYKFAVCGVYVFVYCMFFRKSLAEFVKKCCIIKKGKKSV